MNVNAAGHGGVLTALMDGATMLMAKTVRNNHRRCPYKADTRTALNATRNSAVPIMMCRNEVLLTCCANANDNIDTFYELDKSGTALRGIRQPECGCIALSLLRTSAIYLSAILHV